LRVDSGFATPSLYEQCEANGISYLIKLKSNATLQTLSEDLRSALSEKTKDNMLDYAAVFGEFYYRAGSWDRERRVVCKVEKPAGQMIAITTFIVTNMELVPKKVVMLYCHRGQMENFIKEGKNGFDIASVSSHSEIVNANRFLLRMLGYNIFNLFRRLVLPEVLRKCTVDTIRLKLLKIAAKVVRSARYTTFKLCSGCPYKGLFYETLDNIRCLEPQPL
jgi:hypothetical protein